MRACLAGLLALLCCPAGAELLALERGHLKAQAMLATFPADSLLREAVGTPAQDLNGEARLLLEGERNRFRWQADYQFLLRSGDTLDLARALPGNALLPEAIPDDEQRLLDLTHVISDGGQRSIAHRLDRLHLGYTGDSTVLRLGRQAVSWGNGLIYNPVDFFNPFDPAAIDKEYKSGDDMLYGQYLEDSGNDWQFVSVWRRDDEGHVDPAVSTQAIKYHAFVGEREIDLLLAKHYDDSVISAGGISNLGGAILRGDLMLTDTKRDRYLSLVANLSYSWVWGGHNVSGVLEYYYNGLGLRERDYPQLPMAQDLLPRLQRGELFTVGRHYLAAGLTIELTPLLYLMPNAFVNLGDDSGLLQVVTQYDLHQDWQLLFAANLPLGADGTEFGGLDVGDSGLQFSTGPALFAQLAFYF